MESSSSTTTARHSCLKLQIPSNDPLFVKGTWFDNHFHLSVTDGHRAWLCNATEEEVQERAAQWDQPVAEYVELAERYLGFQHPGSIYRFVDAGDDHKRLSWTFEKEGTKLEWRWKFQPSPDSGKITAGILDFLMDANIGLSEELVRKTQSFEKLKVEAEKCLEQSERFANEKTEFESEIYAKATHLVAIISTEEDSSIRLGGEKETSEFLPHFQFLRQKSEEGYDKALSEYRMQYVLESRRFIKKLPESNRTNPFLGVLNSKKSKLRELRDQLSKQEIAGKASADEEESTDKTESYHSGSDVEESEEEAAKTVTSTSKDIPTGRGCGRGRKRATLK